MGNIKPNKGTVVVKAKSGGSEMVHRITSANTQKQIIHERNKWCFNGANQYKKSFGLNRISFYELRFTDR